MTKNKQLTSAMAAEILGYSASYTRRLLRAGILQGQKLGHDWILSTMEVNRYKLKLQKIKDVKV